MAKNVKITIDNEKIEVQDNLTILEAAEKIGIHIPRLCYHKRLSLVGKCRACLVELKGEDMPVSSCTTFVKDGMKVKTKSAMAVKARRSILEFLLTNHPLDCPSCKKSSECSLQDLALETRILDFQADDMDLSDNKKESVFVNINENIQYIESRCVYCTRCVRFSSEVDFSNNIGIYGRGQNRKLVFKNNLNSEMAGNLVEVCPVGALIDSNQKQSTNRIWDYTSIETVDVQDSILPSVYMDVMNNQVQRIRSRENEEVNQSWISDKTRYSYLDFYQNRILNPRVKKKDLEWLETFDIIKNELIKVPKEKIAVLLGEDLAIEDIYSSSEFFTKSLGVENIAVNTNGEKSHQLLFETSIEETDHADLLLFMYTDLQKKSPVLSSRLSQAHRNKNTKWYSIDGPASNPNYKTIEIKQNIRTLSSKNSSMVNDIKKSQNSIVFIDLEEALKRNDEKEFIEIFLSDLQKLYGVKINYYTSKPGIINSTLMHLDLSLKGFKKGIYDKLDENEIDVLFIYGNQKVDIDKIKKAKKVIYIGTHENEISKKAKIVLPTSIPTEKNSLWFNVEGKVLESKAVTTPIANSKVDWKIWRALSEIFQSPLPFNDLKELRNELYSKSAIVRINKK